jgi:hypothetical protein
MESKASVLSDLALLQLPQTSQRFSSPFVPPSETGK